MSWEEKCLKLDRWRSRDLTASSPAMLLYVRVQIQQYISGGCGHGAPLVVHVSNGVVDGLLSNREGRL